MGDTPLVDGIYVSIHKDHREVFEELVPLAKDLERHANAMAEVLESAKESIAYSSHDDSVGYYVCCQTASYMPHQKDCRLNKVLVEWNKFLAENKD